MKKLLSLAVALLLVLCVITVTLAQSAKTETVNGWVSDEKCGAKGVNNADCAKKCIEAGSKMVFVTEKDKQVLNIDNPDAVKDHVGHHVAVQGSVDNGTLHVDSVTMLAQSKAGGE